MSDDKKIVRVELEYDDGSIHRLTGDDAEKWLEAANGQAVMSHIHGMPFPSFDWEIID